MFGLDSYEKLAESAHETVVAYPDHVLRIHNATEGMTPAERARYGENLLLNVETMDLNFAGLALRRQVLISQNPMGDSEVVMTSEPRLKMAEKPPLFYDETSVDKNVFEIISEQRSLRKSLGAIASIGVKVSQFNGLIPDTDEMRIAMDDDHSQPRVIISGLLIDKLQDQAGFVKNVERLHKLNHLVQAKNLSAYQP